MPSLNIDTRYMSEVGRQVKKHHLLSRETEIECAKAMERGAMARKGLLPFKTDKERIALVRQGITARNKMIGANLRLVISIAKKFANFTSVMTLEDLIEEGNIGLIRATDKFRWRKGRRFSTLATLCIRHDIIRALKKRVISAVSLDAINYDQEDSAANLTEEELSCLRQTVRRSLQNLPEREQLIIAMRMNDELCTFEQIGEIMKLTRQCIQQIFQRTLEELRKDPCLQQLV